MVYAHYNDEIVGPEPTTTDTVTTMVALSGTLSDEGRVTTAGYGSIGDGGENQYIYHTIGRPAVSTSDGRSGFVIDGNGATDWFEAINQSVADAQKFGAVGSGVVDDTAAILAAAQAAAANDIVLKLGSGKTYMSNTIDYNDLPGDLTIEADGATVDWQQNIGILVRSGGYLKVTGGTWENLAAGFCFYFGDTATYVGMELDNVTVDGGRCGVWTSALSTIPTIRLLNSTFDGMDQAGIQCTAKGIVNGFIDNCTVTNVQGFGGVGVTGITIGAGEEADLAADGRITVSNCYVDSIHTTFTDQLIGILVYGRQSSITDNYVSNCWGDGTIGDSGIYDKSIYSVKSDNRLYNAGGGTAAIATKGETRVPVGTTAKGYGSVVNGNTILYDGNFPHTSKTGILLGSEESCTNNRFENCKCDIEAGGVADAIVAHNSSYDVEDCFLRFPNVQNLHVHHNTIRAWQGLLSPGQAVRAVFVSTNSGADQDSYNVTIEDNIVWDTVTTGETKHGVYVNSTNKTWTNLKILRGTWDANIARVWETTGANFTDVHIEFRGTAFNTLWAGWKSVGSIAWEPNPVVGGRLGQICVVAGRPGTWVDFGADSEKVRVFDTVADVVTASGNGELADGQYLRTSGNGAFDDGGGNLYQYNATGRSGVTIDGGFFIAGGDSDDYIEATDKSVANVVQFGAIGDGVTDDILALQAAVDASLNVFVPGGKTYGYSTELDVSTDNTTVSGYGATLLAIDATADRGINITGDDCIVKGITVDGNGGVLTVTGRGEGFKLSGNNSRVFECRVTNLDGLVTASGIQVNGTNHHIDSCIIENTGHYGVRADGKDTLITDSKFRFTITRSGFSYRWLGANDMSGTIKIRDCECFCDQAVETSMVFDVIATVLPNDRTLMIDGLVINHDNYTPGANDHCVKVTDTRVIDFKNISANMRTNVFLRTSWSSPNTSLPAALDVTADAGTDTFTESGGHNLRAGQGLTFTGSPPTGISVGTTYYVTNVTSTTFQLSATWSGVDAINITSAGGSFEVRPDQELETISIKDSEFYGELNGPGDSAGDDIKSLVVDGCIWKGDDQEAQQTYAFEEFKQARRIVIKDTIMRQFLQMSNSLPLDDEATLTIDNVRWEYSGTGTGKIFAGIGRMGEVINKGLTIINQGTGDTYIANSNTNRMWSTFDGTAMHYNHLMSKYYESPNHALIGISGSRVGVRATNASTDTRHWNEANLSSLTASEGDILLNDEPSNGYGYGWAYDGTVWVRISNSGADSITLAAAATTFAADSALVTVTGDGGANTIATITGAKAVAGASVVLLFVDALVTITDDDTHAADSIDLVGTATDFVSADDSTLTLIHNGTSWYETARAVN